MRVLIVDGILDTRQNYIDQIKNINEISSIMHAVTAEDAIYSVFELEPDLIISSEILSFRNGFSIAHILKKIEKEIPLIIVSNDGTNALQAIKSNIFDYVVNPPHKGDLYNSVKKAIEYVISKNYSRGHRKFEKNLKIRIGANNGYKLLDLDAVAYCMADGSYTKICYSNGKIDCSTISLGKIDKVLNQYHFIRLNRSIIANMRFISSIDRNEERCMIEVNNELVEFKIGKIFLRKLESEKIL